MSITPETAREHLWSMVTTAAAMGMRPEERDFDNAVDAILAAELRVMANAAEESETDNMWGRRELRYRADELDQHR